ncbi:NACHT, LRR and PYD domains-containing protein 12-like [Halichoeres trimaculatus]|uniref:NACHT, LRR and PYD domains-containing protein 12-like n=1 Tax=Halichoeres trimaculatus TaxID=147232 RepID=UPI003D9EA3F0
MYRSCSGRSDRSKGDVPNFSNEPGPSKTHSSQRCWTCLCELSCCLSSCSLCQNILKDPVSTRCGHLFCRKCISSHQDQSTSPKDSSCPQCQKGSRTTPCTEGGLQEVLDEHKISLRKRCEFVNEGTEEAGSRTFLNRIYTELYITEGLSEDLNIQHGVRQSERAPNIETLKDNPIKVQDIFKALPNQQKLIRVVLTNGVAGVGKSFSVQKFTLDWAKGSENQDLSLVLPLSFRELNLIKEERYSLLKLLHVFHPTLEKLTAETLAVCKLLFIFDGLDESRLSLDFKNSVVVSDLTQESPLNILLTNLIQGNLLPSALVWITSRPTAANQIPPSCVDRLTEVRGFTDAQKEEYFRRRFGDEDVSSTIISHIKTSRSLHIMCQTPVFCCITATVLEHMMSTEQGGELPKTLTDMYSHFLLVQTQRKKKKYAEGHQTSSQELMEADGEVLLKLGRLAFEHLEKGNILFYQEDLECCGLDVTEASVYSGVLTEISRGESVIFQKTVYCFVHLSVQEFLAAVYVFHCFTARNSSVLEAFLQDNNLDLTLDVFLKSAMEKSLVSNNGHLDLFVRFLHGLSLESNQRLLGGLLGHTDNSPETIQRVINNLKEMSSDDISPDRSINIFHCLMEMKNNSVHQEIIEFLKSKYRRERLSEIHCSALAYMLQMSEEVLDEMDLKNYNTTDQGRLRLIPAVRNCRKAVFSGCGIAKVHCEVVASALKSDPSHLRRLDLGDTELQEEEVKLLCDGLESPNCKLESLRLWFCSLSEITCASLASALRSNPSSLRELDLSNNKLQDSGVELLCDLLKSPDCRLETLRLDGCSLSEVSCASLASALKSNPSCLRELQLQNNKTPNSGIIQICELTSDPDCRLESLSNMLMWDCRWSWLSPTSLASFLKSNPSHVGRLGLSYNWLQEIGVVSLCDFLQGPNCRLNTLRLSDCSLSARSCACLASALKSNPFCLSELDLSKNKLQDSGLEQLCGFLQSPISLLKTLRLNTCSLSENACASLASAFKSRVSGLSELDLSGNKLQDSGLKQLCYLLQSRNCGLQTLRLKDCSLSKISCASLASALKSNPLFMRELDLSDNKLQDSDVKLLRDLVRSRNNRLEDLRVDHGGQQRLKPGVKKYFCKLTLDLNTANRGLSLSKNNRKVTRVVEDQSYPDHPDRFDVWPQLLCRDGLTGRCYWEVKWKGWVRISVCYRGVRRKGNSNDCGFGLTDQSWSLSCFGRGYSVWHNNIGIDFHLPLSSVSSRVAVYVDCPGGSLSFYRVSSDTLIHLHTFRTTFTQPLYPGFGFRYSGSSVILCSVVFLESVGAEFGLLRFCWWLQQGGGSAMDQCEDREEGAPPSKTLPLCGDQESQTRAQRVGNQRPDSPGPEPSCVSLKSDQSMDDRFVFRSSETCVDERRIQQIESIT